MPCFIPGLATMPLSVNRMAPLCWLASSTSSGICPRRNVSLVCMADESGASDPIDLTALAHSLRKQAAGSAEREAFLERLRQQIKSGEYHVDAEALARKL